MEKANGIGKIYSLDGMTPIYSKQEYKIEAKKGIEHFPILLIFA
jgi:hypothetical protein